MSGALKTRARPKPMWYLGFYGCSNLDRVVACRPPRGQAHVRPHFQTKFHVDCPCGKKHWRAPMWRESTEWEVRQRAELTVPDTGVHGAMMRRLGG